MHRTHMLAEHGYLLEYGCEKDEQPSLVYLLRLSPGVVLGLNAIQKKTLNPVLFESYYAAETQIPYLAVKDESCSGFVLRAIILLSFLCSVRKAIGN